MENGCFEIVHYRVKTKQTYIGGFYGGQGRAIPLQK